MRPMTDEMLMIRPVRALSIARLNALVTRNAPFKFVFSTVSQSASAMRISKPSRVTPALLTRMSTLPHSARIFSAAALTAAASGHVHRVRPRFATERADFVGNLLGIFLRARNDGDIRAFAGEFQRDGAADPATSTGDDGNLIGE